MIPQPYFSFGDERLYRTCTPSPYHVQVFKTSAQVQQLLPERYVCLLIPCASDCCILMMYLCVMLCCLPLTIPTVFFFCFFETYPLTNILCLNTQDYRKKNVAHSSWTAFKSVWSGLPSQ